MLEGITASRWDDTFPENVLGTPLTNRQFVIDLYAHLQSYHLGQIDYLRRTLTGQGALPRPVRLGAGGWGLGLGLKVRCRKVS